MDHVANACRNGPRRLPYVASGEERVVPKEIAEVNKKLRRGKRGRAEEEKRREGRMLLSYLPLLSLGAWRQLVGHLGRICKR